MKVGYPTGSPDTMDPASIVTYYRLVTSDKDKFFENVLSGSISDETRTWQQLGKRRDLDSWEMYPSMVNAYFNPPSNEIVFPAGILQPPFFSKDWYVFRRRLLARLLFLCNVSLIGQHISHTVLSGTSLLMSLL